jgi:hypothetical protein
VKQMRFIPDLLQSLAAGTANLPERWM